MNNENKFKFLRYIIEYSYYFYRRYVIYFYFILII